jgi:serpin B
VSELPLAVSNTRFACALHDQLRHTPGNLFVSPHSVSAALAMTLAGARGSTRRAMATALSLAAIEELDPAFAALREQLSACESAARLDAPLALKIANALWVDEGEPLAAEFVTRLREFYGARAEALDFAAGEAARRRINAWVAECTEGEIAELLSPGSVDGASLVLTNAIYFLGTWARRFDPAKTQDREFWLDPETPVRVPTMSREGGFLVARGPGWRAVELPYVGEQLAMTLYLPEGELGEFEARLDPAWLRPALAPPPRGASVELRLPRFALSYDAELNEPLKALGMGEAFSSSADFSGMGPRGLFISIVQHAAEVRVDESGTVAAAATAVAMLRGRPPQPQIIAFDRPFFFVIRDRPTGAVLFMGRVVDPRSG